MTRTHCRRGHPLTSQTLRIKADGYTECLTCKAESQRLRRMTTPVQQGPPQKAPPTPAERVEQLVETIKRTKNKKLLATYRSGLVMLLADKSGVERGIVAAGGQGEVP